MIASSPNFHHSSLPTDADIPVASREELQAASLSSKRLLALWNSLTEAEGLTKIGNREAFLDRLWLALEALPDLPLAETRRSKQADVITLLRRPEGATVDEIRSLTGWQQHTVRGVISGALKKKQGLAISSTKEERGRVYRIAAPAGL